MELVSHGGGEDCFVLVPDYGGGEVVVELGAFDVLEAHSDGDELVPGA